MGLWSSSGLGYAADMRDRIRQRLTEHRTEALERIESAVNKTKSEFSGAGRLNSHGYYRSINENNKAGFEEYMDRSVNFIRHVAPGSLAEYANELRDGGNMLKQEIMAKMDRENFMTAALPGNSTRVQLRNDLEAALDSLIERKLQDFEIGFVQGREMNATTQNTVNIIGNISNSVLQITQSGKDTISKETALKLQELVNSEEIKALPENERLEVLDRVDDIVKELNAPTTDTGKVHRGLIRLGKFVSSVASKTAAEIATKLAVAWAIGS
jgi:hypothetical protein